MFAEQPTLSCLLASCFIFFIHDVCSSTVKPSPADCCKRRGPCFYRVLFFIAYSVTVFVQFSRPSASQTQIKLLRGLFATSKAISAFCSMMADKEETEKVLPWFHFGVENYAAVRLLKLSFIRSAC